MIAIVEQSDRRMSRFREEEAVSSHVDIEGDNPSASGAYLLQYGQGKF